MNNSNTNLTGQNQTYRYNNLSGHLNIMGNSNQITLLQCNLTINVMGNNNTIHMIKNKSNININGNCNSIKVSQGELSIGINGNNNQIVEIKSQMQKNNPFWNGSKSKFKIMHMNGSSNVLPQDNQSNVNENGNNSNSINSSRVPRNNRQGMEQINNNNSNYFQNQRSIFSFNNNQGHEENEQQIHEGWNNGPNNSNLNNNGFNMMGFMGGYQPYGFNPPYQPNYGMPQGFMPPPPPYYNPYTALMQHQTQPQLMPDYHDYNPVRRNNMANMGNAANQRNLQNQNRRGDRDRNRGYRFNQNQVLQLSFSDEDQIDEPVHEINNVRPNIRQNRDNRPIQIINLDEDELFRAVEINRRIVNNPNRSHQQRNRPQRNLYNFDQTIPGLNQKQLNLLPRTKQQCKSNKCTICLQDMDIGEQVTFLFCFHSFHTRCSMDWLKRSATCPICQLDIREHIEAH